jgi:predicted kinase
MPNQNGQPLFILVTGIMASGKSTVAQLLAERLPRSVHLRGDIFRRMIVSGQAPMESELSVEARRQLQLRYDIAAMAARQYLAAGFAVVYQDIVIGKDLQRLVQSFADLELHVVILTPEAATVATRDAGRTKTGYGPGFSADQFDRAFREETPRLGLMLDSGAMTPETTVERIVANLEAARVTP